MTTIHWGYEIFWELLPESANDELSGTFCGTPSDRTYLNRRQYQTKCSLTRGNTYILHCRDSYGDAWNGGYLTINGVEYCRNSGSDPWYYGSETDRKVQIYGKS